MKKILIIFFVLFPTVVFSYLAQVNNEVIEIEDFKQALSDFHFIMQLQGRSNPGKLDSTALEKLLYSMIDNYLLADEAKRLGLDKDPNYLKIIDEYKRNLCLDALWQEELRNITVTDDELEKIYHEKNTKIHIYQIFTKDKKKANEALRRLNAGEDFRKIAKEFSEAPQANHGGDLGFIPLTRIGEEWRKEVFKLKPGETSGIIKTKSGFYIIKLIEIKEPDMEKFERIKEGMRKKLLKQKRKEFKKKLKKKWREEAKVKINKKLLKKITLKTEIEGILAWVNGEPIYVKEFLPIFKRKLWGYQAIQSRWHINLDVDKIKEEVLEELIETKVAEQEALRRNYIEKNQELKRKLKLYEISLLVEEFKRKIVTPQIIMTDEEIKKYYKKHKKRYMSPAKYYLRLIKVATFEEAKDIHQELLEGADFALLARKKSKSDTAKKGGLLGWVSEDRLPEKIRNIVKNLKPGEISPIIEYGAYYSIILLEDKKASEYLPLEAVKEQVKKDLWLEKFNNFITEYLEKLKKLSQIKVDKKILEKVNTQFMERVQ